MEPQCTIGPEDRLSRLPAELLARIFEHLRSSSHGLPGPLSRALLPFDRAERFKLLAAASSPALERLAALFHTNPALPSLVHKLHCGNRVDQDLADLPIEFPFARFFSSLSRLSYLHVSGDHSKHLVDFVLSPAFSLNASPCLSSLAIGLSKAAGSSWHPMHFQHLASLATLTDLSITSNDDLVDNFALQSPAAPVTLPHITILRLDADFWTAPPSAFSSLIHACPSLRSLELTNLWHSDLHDTLTGSICPNLERLDLCIYAQPPYIPRFTAPCAHLLPRFPGLRSVHLGAGTFNATTLPSSLSALPLLSHPSFGPHAHIPCSALLALFSGPARLRSLKRLALDMYELSRGWTVSEAGRGRLHPDHALQPLHVGPDWDVEVSRQTLQPSEVATVLSCRAGRCQEAIECLVLYGMESGSFAELRAYLGENAADAVLVRRLKRAKAGETG
ncbi:hypothetical protein JCM10207_000227 [Rhodosporidiobolus poonsookiae]